MSNAAFKIKFNQIICKKLLNGCRHIHHQDWHTHTKKEHFWTLVYTKEVSLFSSYHFENISFNHSILKNIPGRHWKHMWKINKRYKNYYLHVRRIFGFIYLFGRWRKLILPIEFNLETYHISAFWQQTLQLEVKHLYRFSSENKTFYCCSFWQ